MCFFPVLYLFIYGILIDVIYSYISFLSAVLQKKIAIIKTYALCTCRGPNTQCSYLIIIILSLIHTWKNLIKYSKIMLELTNALFPTFHSSPVLFSEQL